MEEVKEVFMRELREVNEKYMASERALAEMEQRYGGTLFSFSLVFVF